MDIREVDTPHGQARVHVETAARASAALVLGHGAGGGVEAPDIAAATRAARAAALSVALVEQPYRVAGRRSPAPARQLDAAWLAVIDSLRADALGSIPLVVGGRSLGARVACRTGGDAGAVAVLCLAFPVRPPGRPDAPDRLDELDSVEAPVLVVQGDRDPFGMPPDAPGRTVARVSGDHSLRSDVAAVERAVAAWLASILEL